jgi:hypothetical protein
MVSSTSVSASSEWQPFFRNEPLELFLKQPFSVVGAMADRVWPLPLIEVRLAQEVAASVNRGASEIVVAPYVTSWTLAFLVRSLAVATVGRPPLTVYSPDPGLASRYRNLTTPSGEPLWHVWPLADPRKRVRGPSCVRLIRSLSDMEAAVAAGPLIADGRGLRTASSAERFLSASAGFSGPKVILVRSNHHPSVAALLAKGFQMTYAPFLPDPSPRDGVPVDVEEYLDRTNNFARGVRAFPLFVDRPCPPLQRLEQAHQVLAREAVGLGSGWPSFMYHADQFNHIVQTALIPLSVAEGSARTLERLWLDSHLRALQFAIDQSCPPRLAGRARDFLAAGSGVQRFLEEAHPPKVEWLLERMREHGESETLRIYCRTELEATTLATFQAESQEARRLHLQGIPRRSLTDGSLGHHNLLIPGPPSRTDFPLLLSGIAPGIVVLLYPWETARWNGFLRRASNLLRPEFLPDFNRNDIAYEDPDEDRLQLSPSATPEHEEAAVRATLGKARPTATYYVPTEMGYREYSSDALVPTLYQGRFVDLPLERVREGDVIMVRSDGYPIDSRNHVDGLARSHPAFAEAADRASIWWFLFVRFANEELEKNGGDLSGLYADLFPDKAITAQTFSNWFLRELRTEGGGIPVKLIGPLPENLDRLLTRIGLSPATVRELQKDISNYRGIRRRAYNYLARRCREHASELAHRDRLRLEESTLGDRPVDAEMGLMLSSLDDLIKFARVTGPPFRRHP